MEPSKAEASVIIPSFNAARFVGDQLAALARQDTDVAWELIVADNGSTDGTVAAVERFVPEFPVPVKIVDASARRGVSAARNAGAAAASGELLLFADADDVVDERWVHEMVRALRRHPFVGGRLELEALNGKKVGAWREPMGVTELAHFWGHPYVTGANMGCTATAFAAVVGFDESLLRSVDIDFSLSMSERGLKPVFARQATVHYRYRSGSRQTMRQMWDWGRCGGTLYARHDIDPPTFVDGARACFRATKLAVRDLLLGRAPVRPAAHITLTVAEATVICRHPGFWKPAATGAPMASVLAVQRRRVSRLAGLVGLREPRLDRERAWPDVKRAWPSVRRVWPDRKRA